MVDAKERGDVMTQINLSKVPEQYQPVIKKSDNYNVDNIIAGRELRTAAENLSESLGEKQEYSLREAVDYLKEILGKQCFTDEQKIKFTFGSFSEAKIQLNHWLKKMPGDHISLSVDYVRRYDYLVKDFIADLKNDKELYNILKQADTEGYFNDKELSHRDMHALLRGTTYDGFPVDKEVLDRFNEIKIGFYYMKKDYPKSYIKLMEQVGIDWSEDTSYYIKASEEILEDIFYRRSYGIDTVVHFAIARVMQKKINIAYEQKDYNAVAALIYIKALYYTNASFMSLNPTDILSNFVFSKKGRVIEAYYNKCLKVCNPHRKW